MSHESATAYAQEVARTLEESRVQQVQSCRHEMAAQLFNARLTPPRKLDS